MPARTRDNHHQLYRCSAPFNTPLTGAAMRKDIPILKHSTSLHPFLPLTLASIKGGGGQPFWGSTLTHHTHTSASYSSQGLGLRHPLPTRLYPLLQTSLAYKHHHLRLDVGFSSPEARTSTDHRVSCANHLSPTHDRYKFTCRRYRPQHPVDGDHPLYRRPHGGRERSGCCSSPLFLDLRADLKELRKMDDALLSPEETWEGGGGSCRGNSGWVEHIEERRENGTGS
jgi:hypothetical protein